MQKIVKTLLLIFGIAFMGINSSEAQVKWGQVGKDVAIGTGCAVLGGGLGVLTTASLTATGIGAPAAPVTGFVVGTAATAACTSIATQLSNEASSNKGGNAASGSAGSNGGGGFSIVKTNATRIQHNKN